MENLELKAEFARMKREWLDDFIAECCNTGEGLSVGAGELRKAYQDYCDSIGYFRHSKADFSKKLIGSGYERRRVHGGYYRYYGIALKHTERKDI